MSGRTHEFLASRYPSIPVSVGLRYPWWRLVAASGAVVVVALFAVSQGSVGIPIGDVVKILVSRLPFVSIEADWPSTWETILWQLRWPRVVLAGIVGGALATCGAAYQGLFKNPLADPYLIGVASGAGLGATIVLVSGVPLFVVGISVLPAAAFACAVAIPTVVAPAAQADNRRLNESVVVNVYTIQQHNDCETDIQINPQLQLAAEWHTRDVLNNRALNGDIGSDGSTPQDRARNAGFVGTVAETVAINPALAISGIEILNQWYYRPDYMAIMSNCANTQIGVWSENSLDRTVVVAVYGQPG